MAFNRISASFLAASILVVAAPFAQATQTITLISQHEAIAKVKAALHPELYTLPDATAPQANDRRGPNGCLVSIFDLTSSTDESTGQYLVSVEPPGKPTDSTGVDFMDPDDFSTPVEISESEDQLQLSYHRVGVDEASGLKIDEKASVTISDGGNLVTIENHHSSKTCKLQ